MFCKKCGKELKAGALFCENCGAKVEENTTGLNQETIVNKKKFHQTTWFSILMMFIFAPVGIFFMWKNKIFKKPVRVIVTVIAVFISLVQIGAIFEEDTPKTISENNSNISSEDSSYEDDDDYSLYDNGIEEYNEADKASYDTGITYDQLARTPDDYENKKVKFSGEVIQVMEADGETQLRIAVDGNYDNVVYVGYNSKITNTRILENDYVTFRGISKGLITYQSTLGGEITIPLVYVQQIEMSQAPADDYYDYYNYDF